MILERELYKSISTTRAISKSLRAYSLASLKFILKRKSKVEKEERERGLPELSSASSCHGCNDCRTICPTGSFELVNKEDKLIHLFLDVRKCIFCGLCEEVCDPKVLTLTDRRSLSSHGESSWIIDLAQKNVKA